MIQYIYFVKCPNCDDEPFDVFEEAKTYALSCLSNKPIISQIEVNRNDFGETKESNNLGTVWSWEDLMSDIPSKDTESTFSKSETLCVFDDFDSLDDCLELESLDLSRELTIEDLVEEMEKNEDTVECKYCNDLFSKEACTYKEGLGYVCEGCNETPDITESFNSNDKVKLEYKGLTIDVAGPMDNEGQYDTSTYTDDYTYAISKDDIIDTIWQVFLSDEDVSDFKGGIEALDNAANNIIGDYLNTHFDTLFTKYYDELLKYYEKQALDSFEEDYYWYSEKRNPLPEPEDDFRDETKPIEEAISSTKSMLDELEDSESYLKHLTGCPECGESTFDLETNMCINCGFNV